MSEIEKNRCQSADFLFAKFAKGYPYVILDNIFYLNNALKNTIIHVNWVHYLINFA